MEVSENTTTEEPKKRNRLRSIPEEWKQRKIKLSDGAHKKLMDRAKAAKLSISVFLEQLINKNF